MESHLKLCLILLFQNHLAFRIHTFVFLPTGSTLTKDPLPIHSLTTFSYCTEVASRLIPGTFTSVQLNINMCAGSDSTEDASRQIPGTFTSVQLNINMCASSDSSEVSSRLIPGTFTSVQLNTGDISSKTNTWPVSNTEC